MPGLKCLDLFADYLGNGPIATRIDLPVESALFIFPGNSVTRGQAGASGGQGENVETAPPPSMFTTLTPAFLANVLGILSSVRQAQRIDSVYNAT